MAKIDLINGYYVDKDPLNYTLKQRYLGKTREDEPKEAERTIGYYGSMQQAVKKCIESICEDETVSFDGNIKEYSEKIDLVSTNAVLRLRDVLGGL